jgi:hypothetical protein
MRKPYQPQLQRLQKSLVEKLTQENTSLSLRLAEVVDTAGAYSAALRATLAMLDAERAGTNSSWTHEDTKKLAAIRELANALIVGKL